MVKINIKHMIRSKQGYICNLFITLIWMEMKNKDEIHPNGSFRWLIWIKKRTTPKIWMDHLDGSYRWIRR